MATPLMAFPPGAHSFAFAPTGEGLDAAVLGPEEVTFEDGHIYSLAIVGQLDEDGLNLLVIDETEASADVDLEAYGRDILVHNIEGAPPLDLRVGGETVVENLEYGQFAVCGWPGSRMSHILVYAAGTETRLWHFDWGVAAGTGHLIGLVGSYPGESGEDYFWSWALATLGEVTVTDGGAIGVGDEVTGEIPEIRHRVHYTLTVDADSALNIYANGAGLATAHSWGGGQFDPWLFIYDAQNNLLFWNDDRVFGLLDAGIEGLAFGAGAYTIEVGGFADDQAGPYELIIETAESD